MKKILLLIIALSALTFAKPALANEEFNNDLSGRGPGATESPRDQDTSFCGPNHPIHQFSLYTRAYCGAIATDNDSDVFQAVAAQFDLENTTLIKKIINGEPLKPDELTNPLRARYNLPQQINAFSVTPLIADVLAAYEKEKVIDRMKKNFKQEFASSEQWYNAALSDSPMDLLVDLNLIDVMLFGSQAQWNNDVYHFPGSTGGEAPSSPVIPGNGRESNPDPRLRGDDNSTGTTNTPPFNHATDCVPPDSPDAIPPSPGEIPRACGNNVLDRGEQCDDGNRVSGDGCGNTCRLEDVGTILCRDPEAITFRDFKPAPPASGGGTAGGGGSTSASEPAASDSSSECPAGTRPRQGLAHDVQRQGLPQSPHYPGPFVGGVLKNIALTIPPPCPPDESPIQIQYANSTSSTCVPTKWCANPDDVKSLMDKVRKAVLGAAWADNTDTKKIGDSIEAIFCVNVTTANRPESPYSLNEGCVDCQIRSMVTTLDKLLQYQIAPMENTRNAFGISNRWGPQFSFDLNLSMPSNPEIKFNEKVDALKQADAALNKIEQDRVHGSDPNTDINQPDSVRDTSVSNLTAEFTDFNQKQDEQAFTALRAYRANTDAAKEQDFSQDLIGLLNAWQQSFSNIQNVFLGLTDTLKFDQLRQCQ